MKYRIFSVAIILIVVAAAIVSCFNANSSNEGNAMPDIVSYNFNIRPILSDKCFKCHGPDANKREAGLRLDIPDSAYAPLKETKGAFAIVRGEAFTSVAMGLALHARESAQP